MLLGFVMLGVSDTIASQMVNKELHLVGVSLPSSDCLYQTCMECLESKETCKLFHNGSWEDLGRFSW